MIYRDQKEAGGWKLSITSNTQADYRTRTFLFFSKTNVTFAIYVLNAGTNSKIGENVSCGRILLVALDFWDKIF